jgi:hypothetical protein
MLLLSLGFVSPEAAPLVVNLDKTHSPLGEPVHLRVISSAHLNEFDLTPLKKDFEVFRQTTNSSISHGREQSILDVTLYPLHTGKLIVPSLTLGVTRSRTLPIEISSSIANLIAWVPPEIPLERQPTILHLEIRDDGSLTWDTPIQIDAPYITLHAFPESTQEEMREAGMHVVHRYRWRVLPLKSGSLGINFGMLDAHKFGQRLRFPVNSVSLRVQAAPAYLPLHVPMGKPTIRTDKSPRQIMVGQPMVWNLYIQAPGLSPEGAIQLLQYTVPPGLRFYAPTVMSISLDGEDALRLTLTFVGDRTAEFFPALQLPYFDLQKRRIEAWTIPASRLVVRSPVREKIIRGALLSVGGLILAWLSFRMWKSLALFQSKRSWLKQVQFAADPTRLYRILTQDAPWSTQTLQQFPVHIARVLRMQLEQACFGLIPPEISFSDLRLTWLRACTKIPLANFSETPRAL